MSSSDGRPFLMLLNVQALVEVTEPGSLLAAARSYEQEMPNEQRRFEYPDDVITSIYVQSQLDLGATLRLAELPGGLRMRQGSVDATVAGFAD